MKKLSWLLLHFSTGLLVVCGCGGDVGGGDPEPAATGSISGFVAGGITGVAISDAMITVGTLSTTTNRQGYFSLADVPTGQRLVNIARAGYLSVQRVVRVIAGDSVQLPDVFLPYTEEFVIDGAAGGSADTAEGSISFGAGAFVDVDGDPYIGDVNLEVTTVVPGDEAFYAAFPGDFEGLREDGTTTLFESFGFMGVNMFNADMSAAVRLAPGRTATLSLHMDAKMLGESIPMWWFDVSTGRWREDGASTYVVGSFVADIDHVTTWSWNLPVDDICLIEGLVLGPDEQPFPGARVFSRGVDNAIMDHDDTGADGRFSVRAKMNAASDVWAQFGSLAGGSVRVVVAADCPVVIETPLRLLEPGSASP
ncbi:MAG: hypothetical protein C0395_09135 [Gemmatimonas sp.]|nr:hypothetical protein [Gemmatimonas sp.]